MREEHEANGEVEKMGSVLKDFNTINIESFALLLGDAENNKWIWLVY